MRIAVISGPNLNLLGQREKSVYGDLSYQQLLDTLKAFATPLNQELFFYQSNHEGALLDFIQSCLGQYDAIIINAGAYTHTSIALYDALKAVNLPAIEVHLSDTENREPFRKISYLRQACIAVYQGEGIVSYQKALTRLKEEFDHDNSTATSADPRGTN